MSADITDAAPAEQDASTEEQRSESEGPVVSEEGSAAKFGEAAAAEEVVSQPPEGTQAHDNESIQLLSKRVEQLASLLEEANVLSRERERIVDRLHQENQDLRAGELWQAVVPVFRDLIRLYDDLDLTALRYEVRTDLDGKEVVRDFQSFRDAVEDLLYRHGVERYTASEGVAFNSKEHKALGVVPTQDEKLDRTLARVVRSGFRMDARAVRILEAEVFRFSPAVTPPTQEDSLKRESETAD